jgi:hypothetical protein
LLDLLFFYNKGIDLNNNPGFDGVCYFDSALNKWMMLDCRTGSHYSKEVSPIHERDSFVIFDEARSRGADMKLAPNAYAAITLGLKLTKDKLMQGAGRMRQLGKGQRLGVFCPDDIQLGIKAIIDRKSVNQTANINMTQARIRETLVFLFKYFLKRRFKRFFNGL